MIGIFKVRDVVVLREIITGVPDRGEIVYIRPEEGEPIRGMVYNRYWDFNENYGHYVTLEVTEERIK